MSPNVCIRKIIVGTEVVDGHLDTCATHCFVSTNRSAILSQQGYQPIKIKPFPIGQGQPLPDATKAHLAPLWFISQEGQLIGFRTVLFLVSNTGGDILIANNILDFLGILRYRPPIGYEEALTTEAKRLFIPIDERCPPWCINPDTLDHMIHQGQCLITESQTKDSTPLSASSDPTKKTVSFYGVVCKKCGKHQERCACEEVSRWSDPDSDEPPAGHPPLAAHDANYPESVPNSRNIAHCQIVSKQKEPGEFRFIVDGKPPKQALKEEKKEAPPPSSRLGS